MTATATLLRSIPNAPAWIELRSELLAGATGEVDDTGAVVRGISSPLLFVIGEPDARLILDAIESFPNVDLLAPPESRTYVERVTGRVGVRADVLSLRHADRLPRPEGTRSFELLDAPLLDDVPEPTRAELRRALGTRPMFAALEAEHPVSFAYAASVTETLFDVSIDTLEPFRRRGHAARAVSALVAEMQRCARSPVWGAEETNPGSLRLAFRLGFEPAGEVWVFHH